VKVARKPKSLRETVIEEASTGNKVFTDSVPPSR